MSRQITTFYKGAEFVNRVSYATSGTNQALPSRSALIVREWCQPINFADGTAEVPVLFSFPTPSIVLNTYVNVRVAEAGGTTKTIQVGTATADSGVPNAFLDGLDVSTTGLKGVINTGPVAITVTASPFAYTAVNQQEVTITGGTVSSIALTRNGVTTAALASATPFDISMTNGDVLNVTYSVAPTMKSFQMAGSTHMSAGGKRLSWTPASSNFTTLDADLIVEYLVLDDFNLTQNTGIAMGPSD